MMTKSVKQQTAIFVAILGIVIGGIVVYRGIVHSDSVVDSAVAEPTALAGKTFTVEELAHYDGSDPTKPIYLALNGLVYDITAGKKYYEPGGSYHWLAGKDSSTDLNLIGGDIIKRKYPVVGTLTPQ